MNILNKLTLKSFKLNKTRTTVTIIGILLSAALVTVVAGMVTTFQKALVDVEIRASGNYELCLEGVNKQDIKEVKAHRNVENVYVKDLKGFAYIDEPKHEDKCYYSVYALDGNAFKDCFNITLKEGRYPKNDGEIILTYEASRGSENKYKLGDTLTLELGERMSGGTDSVPENYRYGEYSQGIDQNGDLVPGRETLAVKEKKTYKVVGIMDKCYSNDIATDGYGACLRVYTAANPDSLSGSAQLYVDFDKDGEKNYLKNTAQIIGVDEDIVEAHLNSNLSEADAEKFAEDCRFDDFQINKGVLRYKGYALGDEMLNMLYTLAIIIIAIIVVASVFVIRNSFAISITEKIKLYGMLSSVGTTSKQIRHNVLFEALMLAAIGIPLGLLLGALVICLLTVILNLIMADMLNGVYFSPVIPWYALLAAALLSLVTIILSSMSSAFRASRVSPITAIRGNKDVKIAGKKKEKAYKTPGYIKRLFGAEGSIAYKNLKRSKKKYRTTLLSLVVSVALFITIFSFTQYMSSTTEEFYKGVDYNIAVMGNTDDNISQKEIEKIKELSGDGYMCETYSNFFYADEINDKSIFTKNALKFMDSGSDATVEVMSLNDSFYRETVKAMGFEYEDVKDKGILYNKLTYTEDGKLRTGKMYNLKPGDIIGGEFNAAGIVNISLEVAGSVSEIPENLNQVEFKEGAILVSEDWIKENVYDNLSYVMLINAQDPYALEEEIAKLDSTTLSVQNIDRVLRANNSIYLALNIFIYGFIIVISLIGVTNIFNTITTNIKLRSGEFAMLKSIGMTKKEFNSMVRLESLFYSVKSLIIGIPIGLLGGVLILLAFGIRISMDYIFPWQAVLISIAFVLAIVLMIMRFSVSKVSRQNIIETIRNDNI